MSDDSVKMKKQPHGCFLKTYINAPSAKGACQLLLLLLYFEGTFLQDKKAFQMLFIVVLKLYSANYEQIIKVYKLFPLLKLI